MLEGKMLHKVSSTHSRQAMFSEGTVEVMHVFIALTEQMMCAAWEEGVDLRSRPCSGFQCANTQSVRPFILKCLLLCSSPEQGCELIDALSKC